MRTMTKHGVGGIFDRSSSVGTPVQGAVRYSADQRPQLLAGFGDWTPGAGTPDRATLLAHGYYKGAARDPNDVLLTSQRCRPEEGWPAVWDCNGPNITLATMYAAAMKVPMIVDLVRMIQAGTIVPPPGFPPVANPYGTPVPGSGPGAGPGLAPGMMLQAPASSSSMGLYIGLGVAALALGSAVLVKKKRARSS